MHSNNVIIRPIITESSMKAVEGSKFTFEVSKQADKEIIRKAIAELFKVTVLGVATTTVKGKKRRIGARRQEIAGANWKKAVVTLKKGDKIYLFEPGGEAPVEEKKKEKK
jgi:large subunit ribosomal protein L23